MLHGAYNVLKNVKQKTLTYIPASAICTCSSSFKLDSSLITPKNEWSETTVRTFAHHKKPDGKRCLGDSHPTGSKHSPATSAPGKQPGPSLSMLGNSNELLRWVLKTHTHTQTSS